MVQKFLTRMNGDMDDTKKRTVGEAWGGGEGYYNALHGYVNARMDGNDWTTLCPAPLCALPLGGEDATWPYNWTVDWEPGDEPRSKYGWGCIIFDTFMNHALSASSALVKVSGCPTYDHRWAGDATNSRYFMLGYDYDNTGGAGATMKAEADYCKNRDPNDASGARKLDGNRHWDNGDDKSWSW